MDPTAKILIMVVNYSHDIATAFLAVSGIMMWLIASRMPTSDDKEAVIYFIGTYEAIRKAARYSLEWILIAGVPRIWFYMQFEWSGLAGDLQIVAIIIKHIIMFLLVGTGIFYWVRLNRRARILKAKYGLA